jgi:hypothetical protein
MSADYDFMAAFRNAGEAGLGRAAVAFLLALAPAAVLAAPAACDAPAYATVLHPPRMPPRMRARTGSMRSS